MKLDVFAVGVLIACVMFVGFSVGEDINSFFCPLPDDPQQFGVTSISKQVAGTCYGTVFATENINSYIPGDYSTFTGSNMYLAAGKGATQFGMQTEISNGASTTIQTTRGIDYSGLGASIGDQMYVAQMGSSIPADNTTANPALNIMVESDNYGSLWSGAYGSTAFLTNAPSNTLILDYKGGVEQSMYVPGSTYAQGTFTFSEGIFSQTGTVVNETEPLMTLDNEFAYQESTTFIGNFVLAEQFKYQWAVPLT